MKKFFFVLICFLCFAAAGFGEENTKFSVAFEPVFGILNGTVNEYVTYFNDDNVRTKESELDWDVKNIKLYGAEVSFDLFKYINLNITAVKGIAGSSGYMQDYDWLNPFVTKWINDDPEELTNYSKHDNTLNNYWKITFGLGANIHLPAKITIIPSVNLTEEYFKMTGIGGYTCYKSNKWQNYYFDEDEEVISYEQSLESWLFGIKLNIETISKVFFQLDFAFSPKISDIEAIDTHIARDIKFNDKIYNCFDLEWAAKAFYMFNNHFGAGIKGSLQYIPAAYGESWSKDENSIWGWRQSVEDGGSQRLLWSVQISGIIKF